MSKSYSPSAGDSAQQAGSSQLEQWLQHTLARQGLNIQYRLRGNKLHLLCRQSTCPDQTQTLLWLIPILQTTRFQDLLPPDAPPLYQVWLYGCQKGDKRPRWATTLYLNQLAQHLEQLRQAAEPVLATVGAGEAAQLHGSMAASSPRSNQTGSEMALALSNAALAKRGEEMAIACYLSETLSDLGVAVRVSAKVIPYLPPAAVRRVEPLGEPAPSDLLTAHRLWVACEAAYSPDPALVSDPVTQKLRALEIAGFHDAVILFQVTGETKPDWALRVDLTPPGEMLREWARWGDIEAVRPLPNQEIATLGLQITSATQNATTLHLCCGSLTERPGSVVEHHKRAKAEIGLLLEAIAPQGLHAATLYGHVPHQDAPLWVEWLDLPASQHPALADSAMTLAQQGDWGAIAFLLHRLLNPNLDEYLLTGGIRLQLLPKQDLLHVMSESSHCPDRRQVVPVLVRFLRQLNLPQLAGVRLYGRRAGQKKPLWSYGADFASRSRLVPEVAPEFAATDAYVDDLLPQPGQPVIRPDLTPDDLQSAWQRWQQQTLQFLQQILLRSQIFTAAESAPPRPALPDGTNGKAHGKVKHKPADKTAGTVPASPTLPANPLKTGLVWGAAGLVLLVQANWVLGRLAQHQIAQSQIAQSRFNPSQAGQSQAGQSPTSQSPTSQAASPTVSSSSVASASAPPANPQLKPAATDGAVFNTSSFTRSQTDSSQPSDEPSDKPSGKSAESASSTLPYTPRSQAATLLTAEILAEQSPLPSFNSRQLDEKLQLYYRYIDSFGPPDVLIVGSSRALRGVDPVALQAALGEVGHANARVFNFGINGATAQVVNLLVQHILTQEQLPRLIIWADGARAFNSGTTDVTYNGIVASPAYQQLLAGTLPLPHRAAAPPPAASPASLNRSLTASYQAIDRWLSQQVASLTGRATDRDPLKRALQTGLTALLPDATAPALPSSDRAAQILQSDEALPDETGFLSLPVQFNPATYYQKYARVVGAYDSDYENFRISGSQESALQSLLKFTEASQVPIVFVNLPLTEDYLDPVRLEYEQTFRDYLVKLSLRHSGFIFRDLGERWTTQYRYFSDPSHLNRYGAHAVALWLAQDAKIPWDRSQRTAAEATSHPAGEG